MTFTPFALQLNGPAPNQKATKQQLDSEVNRVASELQRDRIIGDQSESAARITAVNTLNARMDGILSQAESIVGPTYDNTTDGLAATSVGDWFAVDNGDGTVTIWFHDTGDVATNPRTLATTAYLASINGASAIGTDTGETVQDAIAGTVRTVATIGDLRGSDPTRSFQWDEAFYTFLYGDYTGKVDDTSVVKSDLFPITTGAWVRQKSDTISVTQTGAGAIVRTATDELRDWVKPQQFKTVLDADDTASIERAITRAGVNGCVYIVPGEYSISGTLDVLAGQTWVCQGARFVTTDPTLTMIRASGIDNWAINGALRLIGPRVAEDIGSGNGILVHNCTRYKVSGVIAQSIVGFGFQVTSSVVPELLGETGQFTDCAAFKCVTGRSCVAGTSAEYTTWSNFNAAGNVTGVEDSAGNTTQVGGSVCNNEVGVRLTAGANSAHGIFSGININHNSVWNIYCDSVYNGHTFSACHIYDGGVVFRDCDGIIIDGGDFNPGRVYNQGSVYTGSISGTVLTVTALVAGAPIRVSQRIEGAGIAPNTYIDSFGTGTGEDGTYNVSVAQTLSSRTLRSSGWNYIQDMHCPANNIMVMSSDDNDPSRVVFLGMKGAGSITPSGVSINDPSEVYVHARRPRGSGTQAVSSDTTLILPDLQQNGDRRAALDTASGLFTCPKTGQYRLSAHLTFTVTTSTAVGSFVGYKINGATIEEAFIGALFDGTLLTFVITRELYLTPGDTLELVANIDGASPVFGHASFDSWFSIERIA